MRKKVLLVFGMAAAFLIMGQLVSSTKTAGRKSPLNGPLFSRGERLYLKQCASCHGLKGDGQGAAAYLLNPKPRDFTTGLFRLVSTSDQQPSNDDIFNVVTRGMPGSSMPPWSHFSHQDRWALVYYVRYLMELGREISANSITEEQVKKGLSLEKKLSLASYDVPSDSFFQVPVEPRATTEGIKRGKLTYRQACASCHGSQGKGDGQQAMVDGAGLPVKPRDLTAGIFKGSSSSDDLWYRINAGLPGSPMPGYQGAYPDDQMWDLIHYIQTLPDEGAEAKSRLSKNQIHVKRMKKKPDLNPGAEFWSEIKPMEISLTPLWWRDSRIESVRVQAVHNGEDIAIRLVWREGSENNAAQAPQLFSDGAALQFSPEAEPPFFAMGDRKGAVTIWHWKAAWEKDLHAWADIESAYPNTATDWYEAQKDYRMGSAFETKDSHVRTHDPTYITAWGAGNPLSDPTQPRAAEEARSKGFGSLTSGKMVKEPVRAKGVWNSGEWSVVFVRPLKAKGKGRLQLKPGQSLSAALAIWDGEAGDRNGQKMVSIWNDFIIER